MSDNRGRKVNPELMLHSSNGKVNYWKAIGGTSIFSGP